MSGSLFSPARLLPFPGGGGLILVSGIISRDPTAKNDCGRQAEAVFAQMEMALATHGATLKHVVQMRCFLVDLADYDAYNAVRRRLFAGMDPLPASATVGVATLLGEGTRLEVEATAFLPPA